MFGTVCGKKKAIWHFRKGKEAEKFCRFLIDIFKYLNPALTIIDAVYVMDRAGPIKGRTRHLGYLISGTEPIALEIVCAKLINLKPDDVPIIKTAKRRQKVSVSAARISRRLKFSVTAYPTNRAPISNCRNLYR
jgi:uncharacterized protein (DUF362 family)